MLDCIDSFKTGSCGCGCGCVPCKNPKPVDFPVSDSKGDCTPILRDPHHMVSHDCRPSRGGDMTIRAPIYVLTVENPPDGVLRDSEGHPVLDSNGKVVAKTA